MKVSKNKNPMFSWEGLNTPKGAAKAIKDIVDVFTKAGDKVVPEDAQAQGAELAKIKTENGKKYRELSINFMDNQSVTLRFNESGDIYKVKIDGKETPITNQDDHKAAIEEIVKKLNAGRVKYQAVLAKRANPTPKSDIPRTSTTTTKKKQIENLTVQRDGLRSDINKIDNQIMAMQSEMGANGSGKNPDSPVEDGGGDIKNLLVTEKKGSTFRLFDIKEKITYRLFQRDVDIDLTIGSLIECEIEVYGDLITSIKVINEIVGDSSKARVELPINDFKVGYLYEGVPILRFGSSYAKGGKKVAFAYFK